MGRSDAGTREPVTAAAWPCGAAAAPASSGQSLGVRAATTRARRARGRATTSAPLATHAWPTSRTSRLGVHTSASTCARSGIRPHSSCSSRVSVSTGFSPTSTAPPAPSAQRPAQRRDPRRRGGRRASGRRRRAPRTARRSSASASSPAAGPSASAAARARGRRRCAKPARRAASPSWDGEPRSLQRGDRGVGRGVVSAVGSYASSRQRDRARRRRARGRGRGCRARSSRRSTT